MAKFFFTVILFTVSVHGGEGVKRFYFPHLGDGPGLRIVFHINNPSPRPANGSLKFFDPLGRVLDLEVDGTSGFDDGPQPLTARTRDQEIQRAPERVRTEIAPSRLKAAMDELAARV